MSEKSVREERDGERMGVSHNNIYASKKKHVGFFMIDRDTNYF